MCFSCNARQAFVEDPLTWLIVSLDWTVPETVGQLPSSNSFGSLPCVRVIITSQFESSHSASSNLPFLIYSSGETHFHFLSSYLAPNKHPVWYRLTIYNADKTMWTYLIRGTAINFIQFFFAITISWKKWHHSISILNFQEFLLIFI